LLGLLSLCRLIDLVRKATLPPVVLCLLILRTIGFAVFKAKGGSTSDFFLNLVPAFESLSRVIRGSDVELCLRVDQLGESTLVLSAVGVVKLDLQLLELLHLCLEALTCHFLEECSQLEVGVGVLVGNLNLVAEPA